MTMRAWVVAPDGRPGLVRTERPVPTPGPDELLVRVQVCGVCRTDLHLALHELAPRRAGTVPGHEVVGTRARDRRRTYGASRPGERVGVAWLRSTCGRCTWCRRGAENLCPDSTYTGWDADGGYADYLTVPAAFAYALPDHRPRARRRRDRAAALRGHHRLPRAQAGPAPPGGRLGIYGFGASAHITAQIALAQGAEVHVLTRDEPARALALRLGAASAGPADRRPARPAGRGRPVRARGRPGAGRPRGAGPRRDARRGRHPPQRRPGPGLPAAPVPRAHPHQRHRQHASRRRGAARARPAARGATAGRGPTTSRTASRALSDLEAGRFTGAAVIAVGGRSQG